jgi:hypothetical protein
VGRVSSATLMRRRCVGMWKCQAGSSKIYAMKLFARRRCGWFPFTAGLGSFRAIYGVTLCANGEREVVWSISTFTYIV